MSELLRRACAAVFGSSDATNASSPARTRIAATLSLTDDVFLRSYNWAWLQLGVPLPVGD